MQTLSLPEQLMLVALDPNRGGISGSPVVYIAMAGGVVLDLVAGGVAVLQEGQVRIDSRSTATGVPVPADALVDPNGNPHPRKSPVPFYEDDRVRVSATLVQHASVFPALAFRFDTDDGSVVFSGDTGPSENLVELARGADVLVHEVIAREWAERLLPAPRDPAQEGLFQHLLNAHTVVEDVGPIVERAGAKTLVLSHFVPGSWPEEEWLAAKIGFSGSLVVGQDLDRIGVGSR